MPCPELEEFDGKYLPLEIFDNYVIEYKVLTGENGGAQVFWCAIKKVAQWEERPDIDVALYNSSDRSGHTTDFDKGMLFMRGFIKWDGCSNWGFNSTNIMVHFCGQKEAEQMGELFSYLYNRAL